MSGQVGPEAALCGEGTSTELAGEGALPQMSGLVQTESSRAAEDAETDSALVGGLGGGQGRSSHGGCGAKACDSLARHCGANIGA